MATLVGGVASLATAGTADGQGAQKRALVVTNPDDNQSQCQAGSTGATNGFAILNAPGKVGSVTKVNGEVSLKRGPANTTFFVNLAQGGTCVPQGMLTTNGQGNGNFHIDQPGALGAGPYYVVLQDSTMQEAYATSSVLLK
jgi:hypothetical protein